MGELSSIVFIYTEHIIILRNINFFAYSSNEISDLSCEQIGMTGPLSSLGMWLLIIISLAYACFGSTCRDCTGFIEASCAIQGRAYILIFGFVGDSCSL